MSNTFQNDVLQPTDDLLTVVNKINDILNQIITAIGTYPSLQAYVQDLSGGVKGTVNTSVSGAVVNHNFGNTNYQVVVTPSIQTNVWISKGSNSVTIFAASPCSVDYVLVNTTNALRHVSDYPSETANLTTNPNTFTAQQTFSAPTASIQATQVILGSGNNVSSPKSTIYLAVSNPAGVGLDQYGNILPIAPNSVPTGQTWNVSDKSGNTVLTAFTDGTKVLKSANNTLDDGSGNIVAKGNFQATDTAEHHFEINNATVNHGVYVNNTGTGLRDFKNSRNIIDYIASTGEIQLFSGTPSNLGINIDPSYGLHQLGGGTRFQALAIPAAPTLSTVGAVGTTSYTYYVVAIDKNGNRTTPSPYKTITTGNATLSSSNYVKITWTAVPGAVSYDILKGSYSTALAKGVVGTTVNDTGQATSSYTYPTRNETADVTVDGMVMTPYSGNNMMVGSMADLNGKSYAAAVAASAGSTLNPFGVVVGGGTNGREAFTIDSSGRVAIGGVTPRYGFHQVGGGLRVQALSTPQAPIVNVIGTAGSTTYQYYVVAVDAQGNKTLVGPAGVTSTGNATLNSTNYNHIYWQPITGAVSYDILKGNTSTALAVGVTALYVNDTGQATQTYYVPQYNGTADSQVDGDLTVGTLSFNSATGIQFDTNGNVTAVGTSSGSWSVVDKNNIPVFTVNTAGNKKVTTASGTALDDGSGNIITNSGVYGTLHHQGGTYFTVGAFSGYGSGYAELWYDGNNHVLNFWDNNNANITLGAKAFTVASLRSIKTNIVEDTSSSLAKINATKVYNYQHKADFEHWGADEKGEHVFLGMKDKSKVHVHKGLIVEEAPHDILTADKKGIDLYAMGTTTWKAVQELSADLEAEKEKNRILEERIAKLEKLIMDK